MLRRLRGGLTHRRTWLLDITSDIAVPAVAALSCNADGFGLCCGLAARATQAEAARAALLKMAQMELAWHVVQAKHTHRGAGALNTADRRHAQRYAEVAVHEHPALQPTVPPNAADDLPEGDPRTILAALRERLAGAGLYPVP